MQTQAATDQIKSTFCLLFSQHPKSDSCISSINSLSKLIHEMTGELYINGAFIKFSERLPDGCYRAWTGDYDLDITTGYGKTHREAAIDLVDQMEPRS